jgi:hypothetical protein
MSVFDCLSTKTTFEETTKMKLQMRVILTIVAIAGAVFMMACEQIDEANKLIQSSNKKVAEAATLLDKTTSDSSALLSTDFEDAKDFKAKNEAKAKEILANYDKCSEMFKAAAKDYEDAGKLKVNDKLKSYLDLKGKQTAKTSEYIAALKGGIQAFLNAQDAEALTKLVGEAKTKTEGLEKEVEALNTQVKKFEDDNKDMFK